MKCADYQKLISDRLDGSLSRAEQEKLEAHLQVCPDCRLYEQELQTIEREIRKLPAGEPEDLAGLEAGLRERLVRVEARGGINRRKGRLVKWAPAWAVSLLLVVAAVYLVFFRLERGDQHLDLATLMSFEDSYLTLTQALNNDESLKEKYNEEILKSIFEDVQELNKEAPGLTDDYQEQNIEDINQYTLPSENNEFSEGK